MVKVWRLALAVFAVMLVDCAIRSGCAHVERYRKGELGPCLPASEDLQTSKDIRTHVLMTVAMLLVMVRSKIAPFVTKLWMQPSTFKLAIVCSSLMLPSVVRCAFLSGCSTVHNGWSIR